MHLTHVGTLNLTTRIGNESMHEDHAITLKHSISTPTAGHGAPDYAVGRLLLRHKQIGSWRIELPAGRVFASRRSSEIFGLPHTDEPMGLERFFECFAAQDRATAAQLVKNAIQNRCGFHFVLQLAGTDGAGQMVECLGDVELARNGSARSVVGTLSDVTGQINSENIALSRTMILSAMLDRIPAAIAVLDRSMNYIMVSEHWAVGHGAKSSEALKGLCHYDVQADMISDEMRKDHRQVLAGASLRRERDLIRDVKGEPISQTCVMTPWYRGKDQVGGMIIMLSKVDERHSIEPSGEMPTMDEFSSLLDDVA